MSAEDVRAIQRWYPQIYLTCHTQHQRAASTGVSLSGHDSSVLAHLDTKEPMSANKLARHMNIRPSTLSATLNRLVTLGYVERARAEGDRRVMDLRLTKMGSRAMQASSVLDSTRVAAVLAELTSDERQRALDGLALLARAARAVTDRGGSRAPRAKRPGDSKAAISGARVGSAPTAKRTSHRSSK